MSRQHGGSERHSVPSRQVNCSLSPGRGVRVSFDDNTQVTELKIHLGDNYLSLDKTLSFTQDEVRQLVTALLGTLSGLEDIGHAASCYEELPARIDLLQDRIRLVESDVATLKEARS